MDPDQKIADGMEIEPEAERETGPYPTATRVFTQDHPLPPYYIERQDAGERKQANVKEIQEG
jgi:hypothetical protein